MHKLVVLYSKPADPDRFRDYYVTNHLPLVMNLPGPLAWRYSFDVAATKGEAPYFAVFEGDFADAAAMAAARASPQGQRVAADVAAYATGGAVTIQAGTLRDAFGQPLRPGPAIGGRRSRLPVR